MQTDDLVLQKFLETLRKPAIRMLKKRLTKLAKAKREFT